MDHFTNIVFIYDKVNIIDLTDDRPRAIFVATIATKPMLKGILKLILICYHPERMT